MISEDRLRQAVRDAGALLDQSLPDPDQCHHTFSPAFLNRMEALLRRRKRAPVYRVLKGVACFFLLGGTIFLSTNVPHKMKQEIYYISSILGEICAITV